MRYLLLLLLLTFNLDAQTSTATSSIVGYNIINITGGVNFVNSPFINQPVYSGNAIVDGQTFTISSSVIIDNSQPYYVELSDGSIFDVLSCSNNIISASNVPNNLQGQIVSINIRPHVTLGQIVKNSIGFSDYSDALSIPDGNGGYITYIYVSNGIVSGDYETPSDNTILYPDQSLIINNSYNVTITLLGELAFADNIVD
jgi:hypothetical protein